MIVRATFESSPGGDTTQVLMTAKYLRKLGVAVDIKKVNEQFDAKGYDILHFFNIIRPDDILPYLSDHVKSVVSTVYVDYSEYERINRSGLLGFVFNFFSPCQIEYIKALGRYVKNGEKIKSKFYFFRGHKASIRKVIRSTRMLLPNSHSEYNRLYRDFGESASYRKVVNAIDLALFREDIEPDPTYQGHVICVGRIEGRKNQLNLIRALRDTGIPLTIIGKCSPNHYSYYQACKKAAQGVSKIQFVEHIAHEDLVSIYKAAKVHVLPSWFETTGLSSLEAGVMDCNVVVTRKGDTEEYFKDMAYYCEPDNIESIRKCIIEAFNSPVNPALRQHIISCYTWQRAAMQTADAYREVIGWEAANKLANKD
jgi:glycosyltransferase involved in cell wall biosynthesis